MTRTINKKGGLILPYGDISNEEYFMLKMRNVRIRDKIEFARFAIEAGNLEEAKKQLGAAIRIYDGQDDSE